MKISITTGACEEQLKYNVKQAHTSCNNSQTEATCLIRVAVIRHIKAI